MGWLVLLFVVLPTLDLWLLLAIGERIGFWPTIALTVAVAALGGWLGKREGLKVLAQWRTAMTELRMPEEGLVSAALVLAGAVLLAAPGVLTDVIGLALLFPPSRRPIAKLVRRALEGRMKRAVERGSVRVNVVSFGGPAPHSGDEDSRPMREVIDAEAEVFEEPPKALPPRREP